MNSNFVKRLVLIAMILATQGACTQAQELTKAQAIALAEQFIAENGYTSLPRKSIKNNLDPESLNWGMPREDELKMRFNTLSPKAIGIKPGARGHSSGWSVAFDYIERGRNSGSCRVVTMDRKGQNVVLQHMDGSRSYFEGFD